MNDPTKTVGPPWTPLPARKSRGVLENILDNADAVIDGIWLSPLHSFRESPLIGSCAIEIVIRGCFECGFGGGIRSSFAIDPFRLSCDFLHVFSAGGSQFRRC
jgi:hypothetical protein